MISNLKNKLSFTFSLINKSVVRNILICLIAFNFYATLNTSLYDGFSINLIYAFNVPLYILLLILLTSFFTFYIVNNIAKRYMYFVRYKDRAEYLKNIIFNVFFLVTCVFLANAVIYTIAIFLGKKLMFDNTDYLFYGMKSYSYFIWVLLKTYLYLLFVSYFLVYLSINNKNNIIRYFFIILVCLNFTIIPYVDFIPTFLLKFTYSYHLTIINYGNFASEIITYLAYFIVKIYALFFVIKLLNQKIKIKINLNINIKYFLVNLLSLINKKNIIIILMYIFINAFNIYTLYNIDLDESWVLGFALPSEMAYLMTLTFICSIVIINYLFIYSINYDIESTSDYLFTRMSKKHWMINKIIVLILLLIIMRIPIYMVLNFSSGIYCDFILYVMELFFCIFMILNDNIIYKITFVIALLIMLLTNINYITCIIVGLLLIVNIVAKKFIHFSK